MEMGQEHLPQQKRRQRRRIIVVLGFLTIIDTSGMIAADPLTPAVQPELSTHVVAWQVGVAHKPQMRPEAALSQGLCQTDNATRNAPGAGIWVRAFKRQDVPLYLRVLRLWRERPGAQGYTVRRAGFRQCSWSIPIYPHTLCCAP